MSFMVLESRAYAFSKNISVNQTRLEPILPSHGSCHPAGPRAPGGGPGIFARTARGALAKQMLQVGHGEGLLVPHASPRGVPRHRGSSVFWVMTAESAARARMFAECLYCFPHPLTSALI